MDTTIHDKLFKGYPRYLPADGIKSGKDYHRHQAIDNLMQLEGMEMPEGFVFCNGNLTRKDRITYAPIYMIMFLQKPKLPDTLIYETDFTDLNNGLK